MKINVISNKYSKDPKVEDEKFLATQFDLAKDKLPMFNYWSECARSSISDDAVTSKLVLDFDDGIPREEAEKLYADYDYIIYNSTGNNRKAGVSKFRILLKLKEPIDARSLKHWRMKLWKDMFSGCDYSTFAIGRFFYVPSKLDKGGEDVKISRHRGQPFDFYSKYPKFTAAQEKLLALLEEEKFSEFDKPKCAVDADSAKDRLASFISAHAYTHYAFVPNVVGKGKSLGLALEEAMAVFKDLYAGDSKWQTWFKKCWMNEK